MPRRFSASDAPKSIAPMFFLPRYNVIIGSFKREQFAVLSAFRPEFETGENLVRQSRLVDSIKSAGLEWFPLIWGWGDKDRRSLFVHRGGYNQDMAEPTMELILRLAKEAGLARFIWGERGRWLVYEGNPPIPSGAGDKLHLNVDLDFIIFREEQGHIVTQPEDEGRSANLGQQVGSMSFRRAGR